ncbi:hypothetical protein [Microbacterium luticocti]|uniref:hypothetical protein n=1 Tax=Microbacterium luticocti TaxID=451764 RepID=UPI00042358B5|nr:hypothetical protein [Microbacterium luticocti]
MADDRQREVEALRARVEELEAQHRRPGDGESGSDPAPRRGGWVRSILSAVALVLAAVLVPIAVLGTWARTELVDTDRFVATFAPLAEDPAVQDFVADQTLRAIDDHVDISGTVDSVFDGLQRLGLPPAASAALRLLRGPVEQGVRSLIDDAVHRVVASPAFADIWAQALRQTHSRAIAVLQGQSGTGVTLADDGTLSLDLGVIVDQVKATLQQNGVGIASLIPAIDKRIPLVTSDALVLVRTVYGLATVAGYWLPWLVLGLLAAGLALARRRLRALAWTGAGFALSLLLLAAGLGIGRLFFVAAVSPTVMPATTARVIFGQLTEIMASVIAALVVVSVIVMIGAWLAGGSRSAGHTRGLFDSLFGHIRDVFDAHGLSTRGFGRALDRAHTAVMLVIVTVVALALFFTRPISIGAVVAAVVWLLVAVVLVEVLRRPPATDAAESAATTAAAQRADLAAVQRADADPRATDREG